MSHAMPDPKSRLLKDPALAAKLQELRQTDNWTNWWYIGQTYLYLAVVLGGAVTFFQCQAAMGWSFWWNVPVALIAIVLVGAGQHRLSGLAHEASHHILFSHRLLNDLVSDWFLMFPMFSSTHHYRLQHLAHHQFVNDEERDPDVSQLQTSGHWLDFPIERAKFLWTLARQVWVPNLAKYAIGRAKYNSVGSNKNPYLKRGWKPSKLPVRVGLLYLLTQVGTLTALVWLNQPLLLAIVPAALLAAVVVFYAVIPADWYHQSRVHPVISGRAMTIMRMIYMTGLFWALAAITLWTGHWAAVTYFVLWIVPLFTSFAFFMILRQLVQHGNGGRGFFTNTRVFDVHSFIRFAVFPFGQDYHLPHHMFATIPHYRLRELHDFLMQFEEYRRQSVVVEGYFLPKHRPQSRPTVLDVLEAEDGRHRPREIYLDHSVFDGDKFEETDEIVAEAMEATTSRPAM